VKIESAPWTGVNTPVAAPSTLAQDNYAISNGRLIVTIDNMNASSGYRLTITPL
jgi:hypothetical protein